MEKGIPPYYIICLIVFGEFNFVATKLNIMMTMKNSKNK